MEVGLGPGHIVLDGDTAPLPRKGTEPPNFLAHVYCGQTAGWNGSRPRHRPLCIRRVPSYQRKRHSSPPLFSALTYCVHGRPFQLLLSSCCFFYSFCLLVPCGRLSWLYVSFWVHARKIGGVREALKYVIFLKKKLCTGAMYAVFKVHKACNTST